MAQILENPNGRRMIRLSTADVLAIVNQVSQFYHGGATPKTVSDLEALLKRQPYYLPEDL